MKVIDTKGLLCPAPLIMTKRAIAESQKGDEIEVIADNEIAKCNLLDYIKELGYSSECKTHDGEFHITFTIDKLLDRSSVLSVEDPQCTAPQAQPGGYAMVFKSEVMGSGDDTLGALLMRACINSIADLDILPRSIIIYNGGVKLALKGTDTAESLTKLHGRGVEIIVCGTCTEFYGIKSEQLGVGTISNMYKINTVLSKSQSVVYP